MAAPDNLGFGIDQIKREQRGPIRCDARNEIAVVCVFQAGASRQRIIDVEVFFVGPWCVFINFKMVENAVRAKV